LCQDLREVASGRWDDLVPRTSRERADIREQQCTAVLSGSTPCARRASFFSLRQRCNFSTLEI
jgi:hypothetical protein